MTGPMQRIFRRRASGSTGRSRPGLLSRLPSGPFRGRSKGDRLPWGKAAATGAAGPAPAPLVAGASEPQTQVIVQEQPGGAGAHAASFRDRGKLRRRLRFLRRTRELAFRDIGGLMFDMRRFGRDRPDLVEAKIGALAAVDQELRALERILDDRRPIHELREPGITSCARCGALHASDSNFCPNCGLQIGGPRAMGEVGGAIAAPPQAPQVPLQAMPSPGAVAPYAPRPRRRRRNRRHRRRRHSRPRRCDRRTLTTTAREHPATACRTSSFAASRAGLDALPALLGADRPRAGLVPGVRRAGPHPPGPDAELAAADGRHRRDRPARRRAAGVRLRQAHQRRRGAHRRHDRDPDRRSNHAAARHAPARDDRSRRSRRRRPSTPRRRRAPCPGRRRRARPRRRGRRPRPARPRSRRRRPRRPAPPRRRRTTRRRGRRRRRSAATYARAGQYAVSRSCARSASGSTATSGTAGAAGEPSASSVATTERDSAERS